MLPSASLSAAVSSYGGSTIAISIGATCGAARPPSQVSTSERTIATPMVDAMVSPEGMERLFERRAAEEKASGKPSLKGVAPGEDPIIERTGLDEFKVRNREDPDGALVFKRDGLGWKLSGVDLPDPPKAAE